MLPPFARINLLISMGGTPKVLTALVGGFPDDSPQWDKRSDPDRFSVREALAHLADWDSIFLGRIERTLAEDNPRYAPVSLDDRIIEQKYGEGVPSANLLLFAARRTQLMNSLHTLSPEQLSRTGIFRPSPPVFDGKVSIDDWIVSIVAHDGYHLRQITELISSS